MSRPARQPIGIRDCPVCGQGVEEPLRSHILEAHGEEAFRRAVLADKERGMSDPEIGERYGISFGTLQHIITEAYGANISVLRRPKAVKRWQPSSFREETTTVWSFKQRGDWATHNGRYRGNWSPYIPRNVILKYSRPGDVVLDYFVGGGTTAVEAKLLGRRCIAMDINPGAVGITLENLKFPFSHPPMEPGATIYEPEVRVGDARDLSDLPDNSIDLICAHPPYAGIIHYSTKIPGDLSALSVQDFLAEMRKVAQESLRVLKPGAKCAILVGDARKSKCVVPIGFQTIRVFLDAGFILRELVIKRQHNCRTTGFWYTRSVQHNFLLLAHEYLPIFEKVLPMDEVALCRREAWCSETPPDGIESATSILPAQGRVGQILAERGPDLAQNGFETTTVWLLPPEQLSDRVLWNLIYRFGVPGTNFAEIIPGEGTQGYRLPQGHLSLVYLRSPKRLEEEGDVQRYRRFAGRVARQALALLPKGGTLAVETQDVRLGSTLWPMGMLLWEEISGQQEYVSKEIVIIVPNTSFSQRDDSFLEIVHHYLLIFTRM